jgi:hypothetical protein
MGRARSKSSLGVDIRGDTSAPAMSTMSADIDSPISPTSPTLEQFQVCDFPAQPVHENPFNDGQYFSTKC